MGPDGFRFVAALRHYEAGYLPASGGILDQPNPFGEGILVMRAREAERAREAADHGR